MEQVVFGFLGAALLAFLVVIIPMLILSFLLGLFRVISSLFRHGKRESFTDPQVVTGIFIVAIIIALLLRFYIGFNNLKAIYTAILLTGSAVYILTLIYILNVDIKIGKEGRIEKGTLATLILVFISIITLIWDGIIDDTNNLLDIASTIATIFAVELALLGFMIAFLSHKRKSGVALGCSLIMVDGSPSLVFTNLKDKSIVVYGTSIRFNNLRVLGIPSKYFVLEPYGIEIINLDEFNSIAGRDGKLSVDMSVSLLEISLFVQKSTKIQALTNLGVANVDYTDTDLLWYETNADSEIILSATLKKRKAFREQDTCLAFDGNKWEIVKADDARIDKSQGAFGEIKFLRK